MVDSLYRTRQNTEAEEALIGSVLIEPPLYFEVAHIQAQDFALVKHQWLWQTMSKLIQRDSTLDLVTLINAMPAEQMSQIGPAYLTLLINNTPTHIHGPIYADIVERSAVERRVIAAAGHIAQIMHEDQTELDDKIERAHAALNRATETRSARALGPGTAAVRQAWDQFDQWVEQPQDIRGIALGIPCIDQLLGGLGPGFTVLLGDASMGKSTFTGAVLRACAKEAPGLYMPTETPPQVAFQKLACDAAGVPFKQARTGKLSEGQIQAVSDQFAALHGIATNIQVFGGMSITPHALKAEVLKARAGRGCEWVIVDSGSKMADYAPGRERYSSATLVSNTFLEIALMDICMYTTWQIGRSVKDRATKMPTIHDAKESGAIEQDCDVLLALYRHDYYVRRGMAEPDSRYPENTALLMLLKDRAGGMGDEAATLGFIPGKGFFDPERRQPPPRW